MNEQSKKEMFYFATIAAIIHTVSVFSYICIVTDGFKNLNPLADVPRNEWELFIIFIAGPISGIEPNSLLPDRIQIIWILTGCQFSIIITWLIYWWYRNWITLILLLIPILLWISFNGVLLHMMYYADI